MTGNTSRSSSPMCSSSRSNISVIALASRQAASRSSGAVAMAVAAVRARARIGSITLWSSVSSPRSTAVPAEAAITGQMIRSSASWWVWISWQSSPTYSRSAVARAAVRTTEPPATRSARSATARVSAEHRPVHQAVAGEVHLRLAVATRGHRGGGGAGHREPPGGAGIGHPNCHRRRLRLNKT